MGTSGPGGVGPLSSSRLTRILQEKAEALRKKRQAAEAAEKVVEEQVGSLERLGIAPPELAEKQQQLRDLARRTDWEQLEVQARATLEYLEKTVPATIESRRHRTEESMRRLISLGVTFPAGLGTELRALAKPPPESGWAEVVGRLARIDDAIRQAAAERLENVRARALAVARESGLAGQKLAAFERRLPPSEEASTDERLAAALDLVRREVAEGLPEALERSRAARRAAEEVRATAELLGAPTGALDAALKEEEERGPEGWPDTLRSVDLAAKEIGEGLRGRCTQALESLRASLAGLSEFGVDPAPARASVEDALARLSTAGPSEIGPILADASRSAEEPIVTVVAGLLDEVRPRIAAARRLGRDTTDVFVAMNRAREALRLKIYSEALAAAQESLERVRKLTEDLDAAGDELANLEEMLGRFRDAGFPAAGFDPALKKARDLIQRAEIGPATETLRETVRLLGQEAVRFFVDRWRSLERVAGIARERGFLPADAENGLADAKTALDRGDLADAAETIARFEVELRSAAAPFVSRRVEEMEKGFADIPDEALTDPVRRLLADADVTLRVKQDLVGAVDSLVRAEREFAAVFAAHASALVEALEIEGRTLESMGGAGDEIQRQIDEVQQIFNMGDFVKASRSSQEIRTRAQQQQLLRSEEAVSHAKLSLVELETTGLDLGPLRAQLEKAQTDAREGRHLDAYRTATRLEETALKHRSAAQDALRRFSRVEELAGQLGTGSGIAARSDEALANARTAFRSLDFDRTRTLLDELERQLGAEEARVDADRRLHELSLLIEEGRRLSVPMEAFEARSERLRTERPTAPPEATREGVRLLHEELVNVLRPVLEENLRALERDLDVGRAAGVTLDPVLPALGEARRRIALPVPVGAAALLDEVRSALLSTRGFVDQADRVARRVRDAIAQAELLRVDLGVLRPKVDEIERLLAAREYARVVDVGGTVERELIQTTFQHVSKTLAGFQAAVTQLRRTGGNTSVAENLLHQARMALDEGKPMDAVQFAARSETELERADLQRRLAEGSIQAAAQALARARDEGTVAEEAADALRSGETAFGRADYPSALEQALSVSELVETAREGHRRARESTAAAERQVGEAGALGAETKDASQRLTEARTEAKAGHYPTAVKLGREATEMGRWAIERMFSTSLGELRREVESGRAGGLTVEVEPLDAVVSEAEAALRGGAWARLRTSLARADAASRRLFDEVVDGRWRRLEADASRTAGAPAGDAVRRAELRGQLDRFKERRDLGGALKLLNAELDATRAQRREEMGRSMAGFRDRLWVGERLGVDTTPVMQTYTEAKGALDTNRFDDATRSLERATGLLEAAVRPPFQRRRKELQSEVTFAEEGLHVSVGPVKDGLKESDELASSGKLLDAARLLLKTEEELNLRKSLHRELTNLHFLIDAALGRASERRVDTTEARKLLTESLTLRQTDYPAALAKAREALKRLQHDGLASPEIAPAAPAAGPLWPFRRPP